MSDLIPQKNPLAIERRRDPASAWVAPENDEIGADEVDLRQLIGVMRRRWLLVLAGILVGVGVAAGLIWLQEPRYQAAAVIRLADARGGMTGGLDVVTTQALGRPDAILSQTQVLMSTAVLGPVVDREGLRLRSLTRGLTLGHFDSITVTPETAPDTLRFEFEPDQVSVTHRAGEITARYGEPISIDGIRFTVRSHPGLESGDVAVILPQQALQELRESVQARPRESTDIVDVTYRSTDAGVSERVVNTMVQVFRDHNAAASRQEAERRRDFIEEQLLQADALLTDAQNTLSAFRRREGVFSSQEWFAAQQSGLMTLEMRREELNAVRGMYRSIVQGLDGAEPGEVADGLRTLVASPQISQNPVVAGLFEQLARYETQRDSLLSGPWGLSTANPDVVRLDQDITGTTRRLETAVASHLRSLDAEIASLDLLRGRTEGEIKALPAVEAEEARLVEQMESMRRTVDQLREEYQRSRIAVAVEVGQVEIVDMASYPLAPMGAGRNLRLALGLMLGFMLGAGSALLAENLNTKIRGREEMEASLRVPSVGVIPRLPSDGPRIVHTGMARVRALVGSSAGTGNGRRNGRNGAGESELITVSDAQSPHAEAYRSVRTNLLFSDAIEGLKTIVITSPTPGEGKSTTAANLAVAYAQQGMKVLLVDCDLRKARLHQIFGFPKQPGLTDLIMGQAAWQDVVREFPVEGLQILTSGNHPPNPSELLGGARMRKALELFKEHFDIVILDTPPLIAGPDAAILGSACDGVVVVVRAGQTEREAAQQAIRQLHTVGARVLGAILNDPDGQLPRYSSYYAYQYKYYGSENDRSGRRV